MIKEYIAYLKDNPKGYWFKRKRYGWGWTPARWQGWVCILIYLVGILCVIRKTYEDSLAGKDVFLGYFIPVACLTGILFVVCFVKGEKPRWQWGGK